MVALFRICCMVLALWPLAAHAVEPSEVLADPRLEARARALSADLRCLVCQNQSIDDSNAPLAKDLRVIVRERLSAGDSDAEVMKFLVARYGDYILLKPPLKAGTILLWGTPLGVLLAGVGWILWAGRRRRVEGAGAAPLSDVERERLARIVGDKNS